MVLITIVTGAYKPTYILGGLTLIGFLEQIFAFADRDGFTGL